MFKWPIEQSSSKLNVMRAAGRAPELLQPLPETLAVVEGERAVLRCSLDAGEPPAQLKWCARASKPKPSPVSVPVLFSASLWCVCWQLTHVRNAVR